MTASRCHPERTREGSSRGLTGKILAIPKGFPRLPLRMTGAFIAFISLAATPTTTPTTEPKGGKIIVPEKRDVPGQKFAIAEGELYVPDYFSPGEKTDVVVWF